mgnify:CR=1 FL=1|tara:strand:- start:656 stop:865 length:210 start_codon:yes stop_codon:yes gene_type:complete
MIYKINDPSLGHNLEMHLECSEKNSVIFSINNEDSTKDEYNFIDLEMSKEDFRSFIGACLTLQSKMKNI